MKKFLTALFCFVAADAFAAALDENDWRFSYPSYGVVYDGGTARFVGDETSHSALYFDSGKVWRLGGGFSAESASVLFSGYCPKCSKKTSTQH